MPGTLKGKVALVTGSGSGIGRVTAMTFAGEGAKVVVADLNAEGGKETVGAIEEAGGDAAFVQVDVTSAADVEAMVNKAVETYGRLDCAHNNAGILTAGRLTHELDEDRWDRLMGINLKGLWLCMKYEIAQMLEQGGGAIVNASSITGLVGYPGVCAYAASKHGVIGLTKTAALEYAQQGIRVNAVCPGYVETPMIARGIADPERKAALEAEAPICRLARPEEIAEAVVWLCSDAASFVTGHATSVDGGFVAQ